MLETSIRSHIGPSQHYVQEPYNLLARRNDRQYPVVPIGLRTLTSSISAPESPYQERAASHSPGHHMQPISSFGGTPQSARPALRHDSRSAEDTTSSPRGDRLPSFRQLSQIADGVAEVHDARTVPFPPLQAYNSSGMSQSPVKAHAGLLNSRQGSPSNSFPMLNHSSPSAGRMDASEGFQAPPTSGSYARHNDFRQRRRSFANSMPPAFLGSMGSSTGTSAETRDGHRSPGTEGYSTTHTTPIEATPSMDGTPKPMLPFPPSLQHQGSALGVFHCDFPGCTAAPFQTQYLLNSHANVHSSSRPHYCPVKNCPRGEGGKGFKRKNEMIRHGLVHDSPGYICPFCPLREHKYPRPDNLQRHVRVHHVDKDKDDPLLREVLAQRPEGGGRGRRRRTGP